MTRTLPFPSQDKLQSERILALAAAIALNAGLFMLLMRPLGLPTPAPEIQSEPARIIVVRPINPPRPPPTQNKPQTQDRHVQVRTTQQQPQPIPRISTLVSLPSVEIAPPRLDTIVIDPPRPVESSLTPILAPAPTYPHGPLADEITGTVLLELLVGADGRVLEAHVVRSSGNRQLDNAARDTVLHQWRFAPAMENGIAVQAIGRLPVVFSLEGR